MPEYPSLAALRSGLTTDDADERGRAYGSVLNADDDVQPSDVLAGDPSDETVDALIESDVVPRSAAGGGGTRDRKSSAELRERQVELLEQILDELRNDPVTTQETADGDDI